MKMKLAEYISDFLVKNAIKDCFMVTGGGAMHLNDALGHQKGLKCTFNHHEQACAISAEAYTRMTGNLAAVCVTSGPGGTNAITGVLGGWLDSVPMFILSGQVKRETTKWSCPELGLRQLGDQEYDIVNSVSNMTKYAVMVTDPKEIRYHLEKALYLATEGRGGPVWLDIPLDVQGSLIETDELVGFTPSTEITNTVKKVSIDTAKSVIEKISIAKSPLVLVGAGVSLSKSQKEFLQLVDMLKIPVVTAWNSGEALAFDSPYYVGVPGTMGIRSGNIAVQNCDLLLSLGCRLNVRMVGYNRHDFAKNAYKIIVDIDEKELKKPTINPDMPICADVADFMRALLSVGYVADGRHNKWLDWCKGKLLKYPATLPEYHGDEKLINPYVFIDMLADKLSPKDRIICANGSACVITFQAMKIKQGQRMFANSGCASMGYGLPAAVGVAISDNSDRTICLDGDGSIMMNLQELATVVHNKLNVKIFMINNNGYLSIRQTQSNFFKPPLVGIDSTSGLGFPDFGKLSEAFGLKYFHIEKESQAACTIEQALNFDGACLCEVVVDPEQRFVPKSSSKVMPDGKIVSPSIDDMAPFLSREEMLTNIYKA